MRWKFFVLFGCLLLLGSAVAAYSSYQLSYNQFEVSISGDRERICQWFYEGELRVGASHHADREACQGEIQIFLDEMPISGTNGKTVWDISDLAFSRDDSNGKMSDFNIMTPVNAGEHCVRFDINQKGLCVYEMGVYPPSGDIVGAGYYSVVAMISGVLAVVILLAGLGQYLSLTRLRR